MPLSERGVWRWVRWIVFAGLVVLAAVAAVAIVVDDPVVRRLAGQIGSVELVVALLAAAWGLRRTGGSEVVDTADPAAVLARRVQRFEAAQRELVGGPVSLELDLIPAGPAVRGAESTVSAAPDRPSGAVRRLLARVRSLASRPDEPDEYVDGSADRSLDGINDLCQRAKDGPLVILGEPGAGKTVLASWLVMQLLDDSQRADGDPIPVRIEVAGWDPAQRLSEHVVNRLTGDYGLPRAAAADLVVRERIRPVLDGLDDLVLPTGVEWDAVLRELKAYPGVAERRRSLVVTCRASDWQDDVTAESATFRGATVVRIQPLQPDQRENYVLDRLSPSFYERVWRGWIDDLGECSTLLDTPLWLMMATTMAAAGEALPTVADPHHPGARRELQRKLLAGYLPAAARLPRDLRSGRVYHPDEVETWLRRLAGQLGAGQVSADQRPHPSGLEPHRLWRIGGRGVRWLHGGLLALLVAGPWWLVNPPGEVYRMVITTPARLVEGTAKGTVGVSADLVILALLTALTVMALRRGLHVMPEPKVPSRLNVRRPRPAAPPVSAAAAAEEPSYWLVLKQLVSWLRPGRVGALFGFLSFAPWTVSLIRGDAWLRRLMAEDDLAPLSGLFWDGPPAVRVAWSVGALIGSTLWWWFATAFVIWAVGRIRQRLGYGVETWRPDLVVTRPRIGLRLDLEIGATTGLTVAVGVGATLGLFELYDVYSDRIHSTGRWFAWPLFVATVFVWAVLVRSLAWSRYVLGVGVAAGRRRLPLRLGAFLDWSVRAGLLRPSGGVYRFRHRELQEWLTGNHHD